MKTTNNFNGFLFCSVLTLETKKKSKLAVVGDLECNKATTAGFSVIVTCLGCVALLYNKGELLTGGISVFFFLYLWKCNTVSRYVK